MLTGPEMIKPQEVDVDGASLTDVYGKMTIQPLERGYGHTLGNALRRVLLSSLSGAAISGIEVDGALHEFSQVPDVREDLTELILNLKQVRIKMHGEGPEEIKLVVKGPGVATAGDFEGSQNIEILNPGHVLAHIGEGGSLRLRAVVENGRGFRTADEIKDPDWPIGRIAIDAIFSPVRKVNFEVSNARVGQRTDYDKLMLDVTTDGSVDPKDAVAQAAEILIRQLAIFTDLEKIEGFGETASEVETEIPQARGMENFPIEELELGVRSYNCLKRVGIETIGDLVSKSENELAAIPNFGKKSIEEVKETLSAHGLTLRDE